MSEQEQLRRKERLVASIEARIQQLVFLVQDNDDNLRCEPGRTWWLATVGKSATTYYPDAVHFCDQIGVSQDDLIEAFGRRWLMSKKFPFSALRYGKIGAFNFVTIELSNPFSDYGSQIQGPATALVVSSSSWAIPSRRLLRSIEERVPPIPLKLPTPTPIPAVQQPTLKQQESEHTKVPLVTLPSITPPPSIASERTESPRLGQQTLGDSQLELVATNPINRAVATAGLVPQSQVDGQVESMLDDSKALRKDADVDKGNADILKLSSAHDRAVAAALAVPQSAHDRAVAAALAVPQRKLDLLKFEIMLADSEALRKDADLYTVRGNAAILKLSANIAYEHVTFIQKVSGQKDSVLLRPKGAKGSTWTREVESRGGTSKRTQSRDRLAIQRKINGITKDKPASQQAITEYGRKIPLSGRSHACYPGDVLKCCCGSSVTPDLWSEHTNNCAKWQKELKKCSGKATESKEEKASIRNPAPPPKSPPRPLPNEDDSRKPAAKRRKSEAPAKQAAFSPQRSAASPMDQEAECKEEEAHVKANNALDLENEANVFEASQKAWSNWN
jgi:hypothetical protein